MAAEEEIVDAAILSEQETKERNLYRKDLKAPDEPIVPGDYDYLLKFLALGYMKILD